MVHRHQSSFHRFDADQVAWLPLVVPDHLCIPLAGLELSPDGPIHIGSWGKTESTIQLFTMESVWEMVFSPWVFLPLCRGPRSYEGTGPRSFP